MELLLDNLVRKVLAVIAAAAATAALSFPLWRYFQVERLEAEGSPASLERAAQLQPEKAALFNRLGQGLLFSETDDAGRALAALERATALDPYDGTYWVKLSAAREQQGDLAGAQQALERARSAEPRTPSILWQEMNFALRRDENGRALQLARELLAEAPEYTAPVLVLLSAVAAPTALVNDVLPPTMNSLTAAVDIFSKRGGLEAAESLWTRVLALNEPPPASVVRQLLDGVLDAGNVPLAQRIWRDSIQRGWIAGDESALNEPLYNGDFHHPLLNFGFDWRVRPHPEASVWVEARGPEPGEQSLCVEFAEGARDWFAHVTHVVPVEPDTYYTLHGFLRTNRLSSRGGAYLQAYELKPRPGQIVSTVPVRGTGGWQEVSLRLETGRDTRLVQLTLVRPGAAPGEAPATGRVCAAGIEWKSLGQVKTAGRAGAGQ
jgi:tetratricopeptide (TPR) repeat protein